MHRFIINFQSIHEIHIGSVFWRFRTLFKVFRVGFKCVLFILINNLHIIIEFSDNFRFSFGGKELAVNKNGLLAFWTFYIMLN